jgi:tetratricopeptide (TPR) repeat protein
MSDPLRTDPSRAQDAALASDRDAKIEHLLLVGLDHYFAANYELAINVWTRALFLDRSHARARAYIERARSALAERQRESEELLQTGLAAFHRGDGEQARRLLQAAIEAGAPSEEALAVLERLNRIETAIPAAAADRSDRALRGRAPRDAAGERRPIRGMVAVTALAAAIVALAGLAVARDRVDWQSLVALARSAIRADSPAAAVQTPVAREVRLPLPRRGETTITRARMLMASGRLRDALAALDTVRPTDPQKADADRLRGDIQRLLLSLTPLPAAAAPDRDEADRRIP